MNMFTKTKANSVTRYLKTVPKDRQEAIYFLHKFIQKSAPRLKAHFAYNMLGYGSFAYRNYQKKIIDWPIIALASQKHYISIYVCAVDKGKYIAEMHKKQLGKVSVGRSCIRFKKIEEVNLPVLKKVIRLAAKKPGLVGA